MTARKTTGGRTRAPAFLSVATIYYGRRRMLTLAPSFLLDRAASPYRRLSATLFLGCKGPFQLEVGDGITLTTRAALLAPKVRRRRTIAIDSELAIFDIPIGTPEYAALASTLQTQQILSLDFDRFAHLVPKLRGAQAGTLASKDIDGLFLDVLKAITGAAPSTHALDPRIVSACEIIDGLPLDQVSLAVLAKPLRLSTSRLRHLFQEELGCSVSHYARWAAVWKAAMLWAHGTPFTELADRVGFYDLAHLDHAFVEMFGVSPSTAIDPALIRLIRCV
ncbi:MAG: AraC family transcriptional regulator [Candidatus Binatia bacterium]